MKKPSTIHKKIGRLVWILLEKFSRRDEYLKIDGSPSSVHFRVLTIVNKLFPDNNKFRDFVRYLHATRVGNDPIEEDASLPEIEVLIMAKASDIELLELAILGVWKQSANAITRITVIVPEKDFIKIKHRFTEYEIPIMVLNENQIVEDKIRKIILENRHDRYGWILQQVLAANWLLSTDSKYTLLLDVDTVLIRRKTWVNHLGTQILMPTFEYNPEYYKFFQFKSDLYIQKKRSFVSHHQIVDTEIFREIFQEFWSSRLDIALEEAFQFSSDNEFSPFDLKFEIYSYYLLAKYPQKVAYCKWANLAVSRDQLNRMTYEALASSYSHEYNSISFHHYTRSLD